MRFKIAGGCFLFLFFAFTICCYAQDYTSRDYYTKAGDNFKKAIISDYIEKMKREYNLTDAQAKAVWPIFEKYYDKSQELMLEKMDSTAKSSRAEELYNEYEQQMSRVLNPDQFISFRRAMRNAMRSSNDATVKAKLRGISTALETYAVSNGGQYPLDSDPLTNAEPPYINEVPCGRTISGFVFNCTFAASGYTIQATPIEVGITGTTTYTIKTGGVLTP